ncbi:MAG: triose-phosphate isomerase [Patescibacteria group bacterium]
MGDKPYIFANWKMILDTAGIKDFFTSFSVTDTELARVSVGLFPTFVYLHQVQQTIGSRQIATGGQNLFWESRGAYTGEVSAAQLQDVACQYVLVGHSERRSLFHEDDISVNRKVQNALQQELRPIVCIGETVAEKEAGETERVVAAKVRRSLAAVPAVSASHVILAYEPLWAISTNPENVGKKSDSPADAQAVHQIMRRVVAELYGPEVAAGTPIIYGGSINPKNVAGFVGQPDIDGVLVGSASRSGTSFTQIVRAFLR